MLDRRFDILGIAIDATNNDHVFQTTGDEQLAFGP